MNDVQWSNYQAGKALNNIWTILPGENRWFSPIKDSQRFVMCFCFLIYFMCKRVRNRVQIPHFEWRTRTHLPFGVLNITFFTTILKLSMIILLVFRNVQTAKTSITSWRYAYRHMAVEGLRSVIYLFPNINAPNIKRKINTTITKRPWTQLKGELTPPDRMSRITI